MDAATAGADAPREVAAAMQEAAAAWLETLEDDQRPAAHWGAPGQDAGTEAERLRWFYTPTDHGGLPLGRMRPRQQRAAMRLVASGLSPGAYVTAATVIGWENVLDHVEGFTATWGRERGRDPGLYYLRVFGDPLRDAAWGWRFGGHHVSLNNLVVDGRVRSVTPCFLGADPASAPLLGPATLRLLGTAEDLARDLVRSLAPELRDRAVLLDRAPTDIVGGNRSRIGEGDEMLVLPLVWRGEFADPGQVERLRAVSADAEAAAGLGPEDHRTLALTAAPKGLPGTELDAGQRQVLRALLDVYLGRVPAGLADPVDLDQVHLVWAGPTEPGRPHYYRLQAPRLLVEWDNTQRNANHAHSVWRDPGADFGIDVLADHRARHHAG